MSTYRPGVGLQQWATTLPLTIRAGHPISGVGSPEGVVSGAVGKIYTDIETNIVWEKKRGVGNVGWEAIGAVGQGTTGTSGIPFLTTAARNAWTPTTAYAACLLTDSDPPFQLSIWANGAWN